TPDGLWRRRTAPASDRFPWGSGAPARDGPRRRGAAGGRRRAADRAGGGAEPCEAGRRGGVRIRARAMTGAASAGAARRLGARLGADVGDLLVDPVARVAGGDDRLEALGAALAGLGAHGQGGVDGVGELLDVERVDRQRELAELLV